jgi:hypothetical protein
MLQIIGGILQIIFLLLKNKFEKDEEVRKQKEALHAEVKTAIASRDADAINAVICKLRS